MSILINSETKMFSDGNHSSKGTGSRSSAVFLDGQSKEGKQMEIGVALSQRVRTLDSKTDSWDPIFLLFKGSDGSGENFQS